MTQREQVLSMLREAGDRGVLSRDFIAAYMPRAAARIEELKAAGYEITSEREGKYARYRLAAPVGYQLDAEGSLPGPPERSVNTDQGASVPPHSQAPPSPEGGTPGHLFDVPETPSERPCAPSAYDPWADAA